MKIIFVTLTILTQSAFAKTCDEGTVLRLLSRTECQESNSPKGCSQLSFFEGTAAAGTLAAAAKTNTQAKLINDFLKEGQKFNNALFKDYRKTLEVYYEIKKKDPSFISEADSTKMSDRNSEFRMDEYKRYKIQMDADPRLKDNIFLKELNRYGAGGANDIFQRAGSYVTEKFPQFKIPGSDKALMMARYFVSGYAIWESRLIFNEASATAGFSKNVRPLNMEALKEWNQKAQPKTTTRGKIGKAAGIGTIAMVAATPVVVHAQTTSCLKIEGLTLTEEEISSLTQAVSLRKGLLSSSSPCEKIEITSEGLKELLAKKIPSPSMMKFLCKQEEILGQKQDSNFNEKQALKFTDSSQCLKPWTIETKLGTVTTQMNSQGGWNFPGFSADTLQASDTLERRFKDVVANSMNQVRVEPAAYCADASQGAEAQFSCDVARGLNTMGQMAPIRDAVCGTISFSEEESASRQH